MRRATAAKTPQQGEKRRKKREMKSPQQGFEAEVDARTPGQKMGVLVSSMTPIGENRKERGIKRRGGDKSKTPKRGEKKRKVAKELSSGRKELKRCKSGARV